MKTKIASLGFTKDDRESIAAEIADNLEVKEDATDEEVNAAIDVAIEAAIPMLKVAQSIKNRAINESRRSVDPKETVSGGISDQAGSENNTQEDEPSWFKSYREAQDKRFVELEAKGTSTVRREKLEEALKDVNEAFRAKALKDFGRMNFGEEDAFIEYLDETKEDVAAFMQSEVNMKLSNSHVPSGGGSTREDSEKIASLITSGTKEIINQPKN